VGQAVGGRWGINSHGTNSWRSGTRYRYIVYRRTRILGNPLIGSNHRTSVLPTDVPFLPERDVVGLFFHGVADHVSEGRS
jgi:hypothetical protein